MRTLHLGVRVADLERSKAFYGALGYEVVGQVPGTPIGDLTMLKLPADPFVTLELVARSGPTGPGALSHLVIQVESLDEFVSELAATGVAVEPPAPPASPDEIRTAWVTDPDGTRIELVQWPDGHPPGMTAADFTP